MRQLTASEASNEAAGSRALILRIRAQREFEEWISQDTSLGQESLEGWRDKHGLALYEDVDIRNKWSGWLAARTGQHSWEAIE